MRGHLFTLAVLGGVFDDSLRVLESDIPAPPSMQIPWAGRGKPKSRSGHTPGTAKRRRWKAWRRGGRKGVLR